MSALKALARDSARIRSSNFSLDERKWLILIAGCCSLNFLLSASASSAVVLEYQTSPFSFFAPSTKRAWRSAAGSFPSAASVDSRFCASDTSAAPTRDQSETKKYHQKFHSPTSMEYRTPYIHVSLARACGRGRGSSKLAKL